MYGQVSYFGLYDVDEKGDVSRDADAMFATAKPEKKLKGMELVRLNDEYARHGAVSVGLTVRRQWGRNMGWLVADGRRLSAEGSAFSDVHEWPDDDVKTRETTCRRVG